MWGPYDRTPYDRGLSAGSIYSQILSGTFKVTAALTSSISVFLSLLGQYKMSGYRIRARPNKLLRGTVEYTGKMIKTTNKTLLATYKVLAQLFTVSSFYRTLAATYKVQAKMTKQMYVSLLATTVWIGSRLRIQEVLGWDYSGNFAPGDRIKVDRDRLTVTLNGSNVMHLVDGDLPFFSPGPNVLNYSDSEGVRQIKIRVLWRGRWL